jgi:hypothetical protein
MAGTGNAAPGQLLEVTERGPSQLRPRSAGATTSSPTWSAAWTKATPLDWSANTKGRSARSSLPSGRYFWGDTCVVGVLHVLPPSVEVIVFKRSVAISSAGSSMAPA